MSTILVVDDNAANREYLTWLLRYSGHRLLEAADGAEALEVLRREPGDLVISDILMPKMDGLELVRQLRADTALAGTPVMFLSASYLQREAQALAQAVGVPYVLSKPAEPLAILGMVNAALGLGPASVPPPPTRPLPDALRVVSAKLAEKAGELVAVRSRLARLVDLGLDLALEREPARLLEKFCHAARDIFGATYAAVGVLEDKAQTFRHFVTSGLDGETPARPGGPPLDQGLLGRVLAERRPVRVRDVPAEPRAMGLSAHHPQMRSFLGLPMASTTQLYGLLYLTDKVGADEFSEEDEQVGVLLAAQAAVAYENAQLYDKIQCHAAQLELEVAERKRAQEALHRSEEHFRALIENSADVVALVSVDGVIQYESPAATRILGYAPVELVGTNAFELLHPDDIQPSAALFDQLLQQPGMSVTRQIRCRQKDGAWRWVEATGTNLLANPTVQAIVVNYRDITERKRAEQALLEREQQLSSIYDTVADVIFHLAVEKDGRYRFISVNQAFLSITGLHYDQVVGRRVDEVIPEPSLTLVLQKYAEAIREKRIVRWEETSEYPTGRLTGEVSVAAVVDDAGNCTHLVGAVHDVTERKRAEEALRQAEAKYRTLVEQIPAVTYIMTLDDPGRTLYVSPQIEAILGYSQAEWTRDPQLWLKILHPDDRERALAENARSRATGEPIQSETRLLARDGRWVWMRDEAIVLKDENRQSLFLQGVMLDITERRQRERELEVIARVSAALRAAPTRAEMLPIILDQVRDLLHADGAALALRDPVSGETVIELGRGAWSDTTGQRIPPGEGISGHVLATGQAYVSADVWSDPRFAGTAAHGDLRAVACVPLMVRERGLGALWAGRMGTIADGEVRLLTAIADIAASAIHRATLHEQTEQRLQRLAALRTIDTAISSSLDRRLTLNVLLEQVLTQLSVDAAAVSLFSPYTQALEFAAGRGFRGRRIEHSRLRLGEGYAGRAALERRTIQVPSLAEEEPDFSRAPLLAGEDFQAYYGVPLVAKGQVEGVLEIFHRAPLRPDPEWLDFLEALAGQAAIAIDSANLFDDLQRSNLQLTLAYDATIEGWSRALDLRDKETEGHTQRVTEMTLTLARAVGVSEEELVHVRRGALLHDIGEMGVPDHILLKPGALTEEEWEIMRQHPTLAYEMLAPITYLRLALDIPYCHHEKWDGTGYARGLKGEQIPLVARLFAVVDVWDALRSDRPYRAAWPEGKVREHIRSLAGTHFDPQAVDVFLRVTGD